MMMMNLELFHLQEIVCYGLLAYGITYVITGSEIGYSLRALFWLMLSWSPPTKYFSTIMICPSCNAWWTGLGIGFLVGSWEGALQLAFTTCGVAAIIQHVIGGDGIAANEDFEEIFKGAN
jgi:hypothetical protein